ncbi:oligosaccharide flippase family protein [Rhizobium sp. CRIBSB]|nr:oligosaccharide flippase family protein [Rhizobium sp. CRIBSB]
MLMMISKTCMWLSGAASSLRVGAIARSVVGKAMWTLWAKIVMQFTQLATFVVAARTLASAEFGLFSYVAALVALLVVLAEGGWREFVMKTNHDGDRLDQVATVAIVSGAGAMVIGATAAAVLVVFLDMPQEALLVALFSAWLLPTPFSSVCEGIFIADGRLKALSIIRIAAELIATAVTIFGLLYGWNIFALVGGRLVNQTVTVTASIALLKWWPRLTLHTTFLRELFEYSRHITFTRLLVLMRSYSGTLVVGSVLGLAEAGYYRAAERIVSAFADLVAEPARQLAWAILRKVAVSEPGASPEIGAKATTFLVVLMVISAPVYIGLALMSGTLIHLALGEAWAPAAILVSLLAVKQILLMPGSITEPLLSLTGAIRKVPGAILLNSLVSIGLILLLAPFGMVAAALGQCIAAVFSFAVSVWLQSLYGAVSWPRVLRGCAHPAVAVSAMAITVFLLGNVAAQSVANGLLTNIVQVLAGGLVYFATLAVLHKVAGGLLLAAVADLGVKP